MAADKGSELGELVLRVAREIRRVSRDWPLAPHQVRALRIISKEGVRPARLAETLQVTPRAVTDVLDALVAQQLVEIQPDPRDRRAKIVSITAEGASVLADMRAKRQRTSEELFSSLTADERAEVHRLLQKVLERGEV